jgi:hypothetical protein
MPASKYLTEYEKGQTIGYRNSRKSNREIAVLIG